MKSIFLCLSFSLITFFANAQIIEWESTIFHDEGVISINYFNGFDVHPTSDNGFLLTGRITYGNALNNTYAWIVKVDDEGTIVWENILKYEPNMFNYWMEGSAITELDGGSILVVGNNNFQFGPADIFITKLTAGGDTLFTKYYSSNEGNLAYDMTPNGDGFLIAGNEVGPQNSSSVRLLQIDQNADTLWTKNYFNSQDHVNTIFDIHPLQSGNFIMTGSFKSQVLLTEVSPSGDTVWATTYQFSDFDLGGAVFPLENGGLLVGGAQWVDENYQPFVFYIDTNGAIVWQKNFSGETGIINEIRQTASGSFLISGSRNNVVDNIFTPSGFLKNIDINGNEIWDLPLNDSLITHAGALEVLPDGGAIIGGSSLVGMYLLKLGDLVTSSKALPSLNDNAIAIFPNPTLNEVTIEITPSFDKGIIRFYNPLGQLMMEKPLQQNTQTINAAPLPQGINHYEIILDGKSKSGSILKR